MNAFLADTCSYPYPDADTTVIQGTMRIQDLLPALIREVARVAPAAYEALLAAPFPPIPAYVVDGGDQSPWWASQEAYWTLQSLFDVLNDVAPEGCYFGAHPGDGAHFGYWTHEGD